MRWALCLVVVVAACSKSRHDPPVQTGSAAAAPAQSPKSDDGWARIEGLATPAGSFGPSTELERALPLAVKNGDAWRDLRFKYPRPALSDYPDGAQAVAAVKAWADARGGLPPLGSPMEMGRTMLNLERIGEMSADSATTRDELAASIYLGTTMITAGRNMLEVGMGISVLGDVQNRLRELGEAASSLPLPPFDAVRIVAAEALQSRTNLAFLATDDGKQQMNGAIAAMGSDTKQLLKAVTGKKPDQMMPTDPQLAAFRVFWLSALEGAQRGEAPDVTIQRLRKAVEGAPSEIKDLVAMIPESFEMMHQSFDRLKNPAF